MNLVAIGLFLRSNWRILLPLAGILCALGILAWANWQGERAESANDRADVATQQADNNVRALESSERTETREADTRSTLDAYTPQIHQAPGANDALDPVFRDRLCAGLGELRHDDVCEDYDPGEVP